MKLDQQKTAASAAINIEQTAREYREAYMNQKSFDSTVRTAGELLKAYAKEHPERFVGNTLTLANGVCVRRSEKISTVVNEEKVTPQLIEQFLHTRSAEALSLKVDHRRVKADDVDALVVLQQMEYQEIVTPYYSVVVTDKAQA